MFFCTGSEHKAGKLCSLRHKNYVKKLCSSGALLFLPHCRSALANGIKEMTIPGLQPHWSANGAEAPYNY